MKVDIPLIKPVTFEDIKQEQFFWYGSVLFLKPAFRTSDKNPQDRRMAVNLQANAMVTFPFNAEVRLEVRRLQITVI